MLLLSSVFLGIALANSAQPCPARAATQVFELMSDQAGELRNRSRFTSADGSASTSFSNLQQVLPGQGAQGPRVTRRVRILAEQAIQNFIADVEQRSGRTYSQRDLMADFIDLWENRTPEYHGPRDVYLTRIVEEVSCADASVTVRAYGVYSLVPRIVDSTVVGSAIRAMDRSRIVTYQADGRGGATITINIYGFLDQARGNPAVRQELKREVDRFYSLPQATQRMRLADDYSRELMEQVRDNGEISVPGFDSGSVGISSFMAGVIERIVIPELARYLRGSQGIVEVVGIGHTDRRRVGRPIHYQQCAELDHPPDDVVTYRRVAACAERLITSNQQLSVARGYAGVAVLAEIVPMSMPRGRISLGYAGVGTLQASTNLAASRRVVYRITIHQLRQ
jgi:hypothetical protein